MSPAPTALTTWCERCGAVNPLPPAKAGRRCDVDEHPAVARRYVIQGIPALRFFEGGRLRHRLVGVQPRAVSEQHLEARLAAGRPQGTCRDSGAATPQPGRGGSSKPALVRHLRHGTAVAAQAGMDAGTRTGGEKAGTRSRLARRVPTRSLHSRRSPDPAPWPRATFPGARLARIADAPARCPNCGGPWRRLLASVACVTCPTELYAVAELNRAEVGDGSVAAPPR